MHAAEDLRAAREYVRELTADLEGCERTVDRARARLAEGVKREQQAELTVALVGMREEL